MGIFLFLGAEEERVKVVGFSFKNKLMHTQIRASSLTHSDKEFDFDLLF